MADTNVTILDASGVARSIDVHSQANNDLREVIVQGDATAATTAAVQTTIPTDATGGVVVRPVGGAHAPAATTTRVLVTPSTTAQNIWPDRPSRRGGSIYNASSATCYLQFTTTAALNTYDVAIPAGGLYELPGGANLRVTAPVSLIWEAAASGTLRTVEWTV